MRRRWRLRCSGAFCVAAWLSLIPAIPNAARAQEVRAAGEDRVVPEIRDILQAMLKVYRECHSYRDDGRITMLQQQFRVNQYTKMPSRNAWQRPNRLHVLGGMQSIACDGATLQITLDAFQQYKRLEAPPRLTMDDVRVGSPGAGVEQGFPEVLEFLIGENVYDRWMEGINNLRLREVAPPPELRDREFHAVAYTTRYRAEVLLYIDRQSHLLLRCEIDNSKAQLPEQAAALAAGQNLPKMNVLYQFQPIEIDGEIDEAAFVVRAPENMQRVEHFEAPSPDEFGPEAGGELSRENNAEGLEHPLLGKALPLSDLDSAMDLDGQQIDPDALTGKIVVLFFWSPDGGPGSLASLQMVQRLVERFKNDEGVRFLSVAGVSGPSREQSALIVRDLLHAKKATYRTLLDTDASLARAFRIADLPMFFVTSADGQVRFANSLRGSPQEIERRLGDEIARLSALEKDSPKSDVNATRGNS